MLANHDPLTQQMCDRLTTTCMGLGLVRLLQDAKRFEEARTTLYILENGVQAKSEKPSRKRSETSRLKRLTRSQASASTRIVAA
jgi:predicted N-formylglutamate amidohydrolase